MWSDEGIFKRTPSFAREEEGKRIGSFGELLKTPGIDKILTMKRYQVFGGEILWEREGVEEMVELLAELVNMEQMVRIGMAWVV